MAMLFFNLANISLYFLHFIFFSCSTSLCFSSFAKLLYHSQPYGLCVLIMSHTWLEWIYTVIARMSRNSLLETDMISEVLSCCNRTRTNNHLVCEWKLNDLAKLDCLARLTKWLSVYLQTKWLWAQVPLQPPTILSLLVSLFFRKILIPFMSFFEVFLFFWIIFSWWLWHIRKKNYKKLFYQI